MRAHTTIGAVIAGMLLIGGLREATAALPRVNSAVRAEHYVIGPRRVPSLLKRLLIQDAAGAAHRGRLFDWRPITRAGNLVSYVFEGNTVTAVRVYGPDKKVLYQTAAPLGFISEKESQRLKRERLTSGR
jgi:hypothetical protein